MPAKTRTTPAAPCAKRPRAVEAVDPAVAKRTAVADALKAAAGEDVAAMLVEMLPFVFEQPRHKHQEKVLDMLAKCFADFEVGLRSKVAESESVVAGVETQQLARETAIKEATAILEQICLELREANSKLESRKLASNAAKEAFAVVEVAQSKTVSRVDEATEKQLQLESALQLKQRLETTEIEDVHERRREAEDLHAKLRPFVADGNMLNAYQLSLSKVTRGSFNSMVLQHVQSEVTKLLEDVTPIVAGGSAAVAECEANVQAARRSMEEYRRQLADAQVEQSNLQAAKQEGATAVRAAKEKLVSCVAEAADLGAELRGAQGSLASFVGGALSTFAELRDVAGPKEQALVDKNVEAFGTMNVAALGC